MTIAAMTMTMDHATRADLFSPLDLDPFTSATGKYSARLPFTFTTTHDASISLANTLTGQRDLTDSGPGPAVNSTTSCVTPSKRRRSRSPPQDRRPASREIFTDNNASFSRPRTGSTKPPQQYTIFPSVSVRSRAASYERPRRTISFYDRQRCELPASWATHKSRDVATPQPRRKPATLKRAKTDGRPASTRGILKQIQERIRPDRKQRLVQEARDNRASLLSLHAALRDTAELYHPSKGFDTTKGTFWGQTFPIDSSWRDAIPAKPYTTSPTTSSSSFTKENALPTMSPSLDDWSWRHFYVEDDNAVSCPPTTSPPVFKSVEYTPRVSAELSPRTMSFPGKASSGLLATPISRRVTRKYESRLTATPDVPEGLNSIRQDQSCPRNITLSRMQALAAVKGLAVNTTVSNSAHGIPAVRKASRIAVDVPGVRAVSGNYPSPLRLRDSISMRTAKVSEIKKRDLRKQSTPQHVSMLVDEQKYAAKELLQRGPASPPHIAIPRRSTLRADNVDITNKPLPQPPMPDTAAVEDTNAILSNFISRSVTCGCLWGECECAYHQPISRKASSKKRKPRRRRTGKSSVAAAADKSFDHAYAASSADTSRPSTPTSMFMAKPGFALLGAHEMVDRYGQQHEGVTDVDTDIDRNSTVSSMICSDIMNMLGQDRIMTPPLTGRTKPESQVLSQYDLNFIQAALEDVLTTPHQSIHDAVTVIDDDDEDTSRNAGYDRLGPVMDAARKLEASLHQPSLPPISRGPSPRPDPLGMNPHVPSPDFITSALDPGYHSVGTENNTPINTSFSSSTTHNRSNSQSSQTDYDDVEMSKVVKSIVTKKKTISPNTSRRMYKFIPTRTAPRRLSKAMPSAPRPPKSRSLISQLKAIDLVDDNVDIHTALRHGPGLTDIDYVASSAPATIAMFNLSRSNLSVAAPPSVAGSMPPPFFDEGLDNDVEVEVNHCLVSSEQMDQAIDTFVFESAVIESERATTLTDAKFSSGIDFSTSSHRMSHDDVIVIGESTPYKMEELVAMLHQRREERLEAY